MTGANRPGSLMGELRRSFWQYKGYSVSILTQHVMRGIATAKRDGNFSYLPGFIIGSTLSLGSAAGAPSAGAAR